MTPSQIWMEHCDAARDILSKSGVTQALDFLVGQKLAEFWELTETDPSLKKELNRFLREIRSIFKARELNSYLGNLGRTTPMFVGNPDDEDTAEMPVFQNAPEPSFVERAKTWLLRN